MNAAVIEMMTAYLYSCFHLYSVGSRRHKCNGTCLLDSDTAHCDTGAWTPRIRWCLQDQRGKISNIYFIFIRINISIYFYPPQIERKAAWSSVLKRWLEPSARRSRWCKWPSGQPSSWVPVGIFKPYDLFCVIWHWKAPDGEFMYRCFVAFFNILLLIIITIIITSIDSLSNNTKNIIIKNKHKGRALRLTFILV